MRISSADIRPTAKAGAQFLHGGGGDGRSATDWSRYAQGNPFAEASDIDESHVLLCLAKAAPLTGSELQLQQRAAAGERVVRDSDAVWIHYANGIARSKITPAVLDRCLGTPATARNLRTVLKLDAMTKTTAGQ